MNNRKEQIKELWRTCFHDPEDFITLYFDRVFKEEQAYTIERDGRIVSFLQVIPYTLIWYGREIRMGYISGACTDPRERGKGLMRELLEKAFTGMRREGYDITGLIPAEPWLFDYYRAQGYTEVFDYSWETYLVSDEETDAGRIKPISSESKDLEKWYRYFDSQLRCRTCSVLHTPEDFKTNLMEFERTEGLVAGMEDRQGNPIGLLFAVTSEKEPLIKEMVYDNISVKKALLQHTCRFFHSEKAVWKSTPLLPDTHRLGMAMVLNREKMTRQWLESHPEQPFTAETLEQMDDKTLTSLLMGYSKRDAIMSLMLD
ncbi:GNAT family N-acetyltransferase [Parabacteroides sp. OttesenSCG-928-J18]|nr:GNAT family N-acetyltransferase [Parabacteroides sp. OttesenSCG-928-J18]